MLLVLYVMVITESIIEKSLPTHIIHDSDFLIRAEVRVQPGGHDPSEKPGFLWEHPFAISGAQSYSAAG